MTPVLAIAHGAPPSRPVSERFEKKKKSCRCVHPIVRALWGLEGGEVGEMKNEEGGVKGGGRKGRGPGLP